ncbi:MAG: Hpt domain-containing protein [Rhizobiales bacterium]|nr:Hpt domain-containing protein [Hyphomicrobiales bacterium]
MTRPVPAEKEHVEDLAIVDEAHLVSFTEGDIALEDELADLFANTARGYLKRMREALEEKRGWSAEAHALKGASANLGARRVAALARQAEFSPPSGDQIEAIEAALADVQAFFADRQP